MSAAAKYSGLPDIDTAPDVYETPDTFTSTHDDGNSSEDDILSHRPSGRERDKDITEPPSKEELDDASLLSTDAATKRFRAAEKKRHRPRLIYTYPPSPTSDEPSTTASSNSRPPPISVRLRSLQHELASLETELSDPSNPALHEDNGELADPGVLMKGLLDVRQRLEKVTKPLEGRGRLIEKVLNSKSINSTTGYISENKDMPAKDIRHGVPDLATMDKRVSELEFLVGSSSTTLDESSPLPAPLLPLITRLSAQLTLLTQPRHIDSISRRLKLLLSDLERVSAASGNANGVALNSSTNLSQSQSRRQSQPASQTLSDTPALPSSTVRDSLLPTLTRLSPFLPHIPNVLARLRTLSTLHNDAAAFQATLKSMEEEERRIRNVLNDLEKAVDAVEASLQENSVVISSNVAGLEKRVEDLGRRMEGLGK